MVTSMYSVRLNPSLLQFVPCSYSVDLSNTLQQMHTESAKYGNYTMGGKQI